MERENALSGQRRNSETTTAVGTRENSHAHFNRQLQKPDNALLARERLAFSPRRKNICLDEELRAERA